MTERLEPECIADYATAIAGKTIASVVACTVRYEFSDVSERFEDHLYINLTDGTRFRVCSSEWLRYYLDRGDNSPHEKEN